MFSNTFPSLLPLPPLPPHTIIKDYHTQTLKKIGYKTFGKRESREHARNFTTPIIIIQLHLPMFFFAVFLLSSLLLSFVSDVVRFFFSSRSLVVSNMCRAYLKLFLLIIFPVAVPPVDTLHRANICLVVVFFSRATKCHMHRVKDSMEPTTDCVHFNESLRVVVVVVGFLLCFYTFFKSVCLFCTAKITYAQHHALGTF